MATVGKPLSAHGPTLTSAERLKFVLMANGLAISAEAQGYIDSRNGDRPMTPADYASTSGVILALENDVWVNAPIAIYNPNFVVAPDHVLDLSRNGLVVRGAEGEWPARMWLPPRYHGMSNAADEPYNSYAFTHSDRVRISPVEGCSMTCQFCDLPYEFRYRTKSVQGLVDSVATALSDVLQPASHVLISGGTPRREDFGYMHQVYEAVITGFPNVAVDIMMVPAEGLLDVEWLDEIGVNELSINVEIYNREIARRLMRRKSDQSLEYYLDFIERAVQVLGPNRVRSMLIVGLEPMEDTLAGVEALAQRGCVPVLSPFRPDESTPLRNLAPPSAREMEETYLRARQAASRHGLPLGPGCIPCTHNTMTLADSGHGDAFREYGTPFLI